MAKARAEIEGDDTASVRLREDISIFIKQEANHYTAHADFNEALKRHGYTMLDSFEREALAHYSKLLQTKSLAFLCAYCEGFETLGPPSAVAWLDNLEPILEGGDLAAIGLWKWHLMEEYEHRNICFDVFNRIHGGYFLRVYGLLYQAFFLFRYTARVRSYLLSEDRRSMSEEEVVASKMNERAIMKRMRHRIFRQFLRAMSPTYSPYASPQPKNYDAYMATLESTL